MSAEPPAWGTPPAADLPAHRQREREEREHQVQWPHTPAGISPAAADGGLIRRQATVSLVVNLLVLFFAVGLMSAPGAAMALRARSLATTDPARAQRSLRWSWIWLASNLLLYLLLAVLVLALLASLIL
jgi:hypothetical protein